jgi:hypothetical protein
MRKQLQPRTLFSALLVVLACAHAAAKPSSAPVRVEYEPPPAISTGDEATTVLTFRALADLDRLEVSIRAAKGLELTSPNQDVVFTGVKKGEGRQLSVTVRLTDPKFGSLAVLYRTELGSSKAAGAVTIVYGNPGNGQ